MGPHFVGTIYSTAAVNGLRSEQEVPEKCEPGVRGGTIPKTDYVLSIIKAISCFNKHNYRGTTVGLW